MSWSMLLLQLETVFMSMAQATTKVNEDVHGLGCHLKPRVCMSEVRAAAGGNILI